MKSDRLGEFEEFTLLAVRALGDHTYAVPVQQFVEEATRRNVSIGAVYAALARLEDKGFVLLTAAVAAVIIPARRVAAVDPAAVLRQL